MADPVITDGIRAQVVLPGFSGLPEDRYVHTFAFKTATGSAPTQTDLELCHDRLTEFYTGVVGTSGRVDSHLGGHFVGQDVEVRLYRLVEAPPRQPHVFPMPLQNSSSMLPAELAVCLSFYATVNQPSKRGRIYFGPLADSADEEVQGVGDKRVSGSLRTTLVGAADALANDTLTGRPTWQVLSQKNGTMAKVTNGWVDDAFDIQRRRGVEAQQRASF